MSLEISLALDFPNCMTRPPPPCTWFIRNKNSKMISTNGRNVARIEPSRLGWGFSEFDFSIVSFSTAFCARARMLCC